MSDTKLVGGSKARGHCEHKHKHPHCPQCPPQTVITDGITILGNGTEEFPLHTGDVPVTTDGITILGNGTTGNPLHTGEVPVTTDGITILGNGTTGNPLHTGTGSGTFRAAYDGTNPSGVLPPLPGMPVFIGTTSLPGGITTVQPAFAVNSNLTSAIIGSQVDGIIAGDEGRVDTEAA